jgi:geranylgeranyl reductase family protein
MATSDPGSKHYEVLVVGGGPAGSTLAWTLRRRGLSVTVWDTSRFPRDKVCAGWITPAVADALQLDLVDYRSGRVLQAIDGFRVSMIGGKASETHYGGKPVSYGIRRCEFDHFLLQRSGADLLLGKSFRGMRREGTRWRMSDGSTADLVVGAGGHFCPVAQTLGSLAETRDSPALIAAQEVEFEMSPAQRQSCPVNPTVPELFFTRDLKGYGWIFRKGDWLNVGLGREDRSGLARHVAAFRDLLIRQGRIPSDTPDRFRGHAYLLYKAPPRRLVDGGVLLIGDAAGLAYPQSGEGIRPAVESALLAAETIIAAEGRYTRTALAPYGEELSTRLGPRKPATGAMGLLPDGWKRLLAEKLLASGWFARRVVIDRWFLHDHLPALKQAAISKRNPG